MISPGIIRANSFLIHITVPELPTLYSNLCTDWLIFNYHILFNFPNTTKACPILRLMSFVVCPSSVMSSSRYANLLTCLGFPSSSNFTTILFPCFPIVTVFVFYMSTFNPNILLPSCSFFVSSWSWGRCPRQSSTCFSFLHWFEFHNPHASLTVSVHLRKYLIDYGDELHPCISPHSPDHTYWSSVKVF